MAVLEVLAERWKGTRWHAVFIGGMIAVSLWTMTGPTVNWVVGAYASEKLDVMLKERGITKESFAEVQRKLGEVDVQTDGLKKDIKDLTIAVQSLANEQTRVKGELENSRTTASQERKDVQTTVDNIYNFLLNRGRSDR